MARTPIAAFGKLELDYLAYGKPHVARFYVPSFGTDPAVGTFTAVAVPASLDALAADLANSLKQLYSSDSALTFGEWRGLVHTLGTDEGFVPTVTGVITAPTSAFTAAANAPGASSQATWTFRDNDGHLVRFEQLGAIYAGSGRFQYSSLAGVFSQFANYVLGSPRVLGRGGVGLASMVTLTFDTNDGLQRRYRR